MASQNDDASLEELRKGRTGKSRLTQLERCRGTFQCALLPRSLTSPFIAYRTRGAYVLLKLLRRLVTMYVPSA